MPAILSKNCIVSGELDAYCLACCALLPTTERALAHIQQTEHRDHLSSLGYFEKYKDDFIRKVAGIYFCELCNDTFPTAAKVGMHVTHASHAARKTARLLQRAGTAVVYQGNTLITESAWNGLVDDTCVLCNDEFDDVLTHKSEQKHILNVIRSTVTVGDGNDIYRKIDGGYQCLTCNKVVSGDGIKEHLDSAQHKNALISYDQNQNEAKDVSSVADKDNSHGAAKANIKPRYTDGKTLYTSPVLMKDNAKSTCSASIPTEVESFAKKHGLTVKKDGSHVYCGACSAQLTATLDRLKEHVDGKKHKANLTKQSQVKIQTTKKIKKTPMADFGKTVEKIHCRSTGETYLLLNDKFFLHITLFMGITKINHKYICLFCDIDLIEENLSEHIMLPLHKSLVANCSVISSLENEFVREVKRDLYHCGHCGIVESDMDDMMDHLDTAEHKKCKAELEAKLEYYEFERSREQMFNFMMFNNIMRLF